MWSVEEFIEKCNLRGIPSTDEFIDSMNHGIWRCRFHAEMSNTYWDSLYLNPEVNEVDEFSPLVLDAETKSEFEFIAALQAIHPLSDLIAQIVNVVILNSSLQIHQVTLNKVKDRLPDQDEYTAISESINALITSEEFKFIDAFVNTIKHRHIIETENHGDFGPGSANRVGLKTLAFTRNGHIFEAVWIKDVLETYLEKVIELIGKIGTEMNNYLT